MLLLKALRISSIMVMGSGGRGRGEEGERRRRRKREPGFNACTWA